MYSTLLRYAHILRCKLLKKEIPVSRNQSFKLLFCLSINYVQTVVKAAHGPCNWKNSEKG